MDLTAIIQRIRKAGQTNVRAVPMSGQDVRSGDYQIEINEAGSWSPVVSGVKQRIAEDIISQAVNRLICG